MYNHAPDGYKCPFCESLSERPEYNLARINGAAALLGYHAWGRSPVDVLVIPVQHIENIYDLPARLAPDLHKLTRAVACALKAVYGCEGVSTRQHNEPAGNQDVWHYHMHVFPRFTGDNLYKGEKTRLAEELILEETVKLRGYFEANWQDLFTEPEK